jgi:uncharacterized phage protein (TIGR01671 family)
MREILFRGKRIDNGEWVEGYYVYDESGQTTEEPTAYIVSLNTHPCGWSLIPYKVIPETLGQYTGLTDKNGKRIFEGDIVKLTLKDGVELGEIDWSDYLMRFTFVSPEGRYGFDRDCVFEVIGNIHDNPELLIGGEAE